MQKFSGDERFNFCQLCFKYRTGYFLRLRPQPWPSAVLATGSMLGHLQRLPVRRCGVAEKQQLQSGQAKSADPVLLSADIAKKEEALKRFAQPILARPKPAPPPPAPEATPESAPEAEPSASEPMDAEGAEEAPKPAADDLD